VLKSYGLTTLDYRKAPMEPFFMSMDGLYDERSHGWRFVDVHGWTGRFLLHAKTALPTSM